MTFYARCAVKLLRLAGTAGRIDFAHGRRVRHSWIQDDLLPILTFDGFLEAHGSDRDLPRHEAHVALL